LKEVYLGLEPELERYSVLLGNTDDRLRTTGLALQRANRFTTPQLHKWSWKRTYTTAQWLEQLRTHSDHETLPSTRRAALLEAVGQAIDSLGGAVEMTYDTCLVSARPRSPARRSKKIGA
jgi:hypothetical protein